MPTLENGGISDDGLTITYHLRHGVRGKTASPFTSRDVKFTWQAIMNDANNVNSRNGYERVASVDTPDDATVVFHLKRRFAPFVNTVFAESDKPVLHRARAHLLAKYHDLNRLPFNEPPIGTGPFKVVRWVHGDHIELVAERRLLPRQAEAATRSSCATSPTKTRRSTQLRTHDVDWIFEASPSTIHALRPLDAPRDVKIVLSIDLDLRDLDQHLAARAADVRVRQAIAYAIDKKALVDRVHRRLGDRSRPPTSRRSRRTTNPDVRSTRPTSQKAKALLRAAG